jgi:hypothetical protein
MSEQKVPPAIDENKTPPKPDEPKEEKFVPLERYEGSVKGMNEAQRRAAIAEKERDLANKELELVKRGNQNPIPAVDPNAEPPEHIKKQLEEKYGVPFSQIKLVFDTNRMNQPMIDELKKQVNDLNNQILEDRYEGKKDKLKASDRIFVEYEPEFEARLNRLPLKDRMNKEIISTIKNEIVNSHFDEIIQKAKDEERTRLTEGANPPDMPEVNSVSGNFNSKPANTSKLTKEQQEYAIKCNLDPKSVEDFVNSKPVQNQSAWKNWMD